MDFYLGFLLYWARKYSQIRFEALEVKMEPMAYFVSFKIIFKLIVNFIDLIDIMAIATGFQEATIIQEV